MSLIGRVLDTGDAVVPVRFRGPDGGVKELRAQVDTGFNGVVALTEDQIHALGLGVRRRTQLRLADGNLAEVVLYSGEVEWLAGWRRVQIIKLEGCALIGMGLLQGCHLAIDAVPDGRVEITPVARPG